MSEPTKTQFYGYHTKSAECPTDLALLRALVEALPKCKRCLREPGTRLDPTRICDSCPAERHAVDLPEATALRAALARLREST